MPPKMSSKSTGKTMASSRDTEPRSSVPQRCPCLRWGELARGLMIMKGEFGLVDQGEATFYRHRDGRDDREGQHEQAECDYGLFECD